MQYDITLIGNYTNDTIITGNGTKQVDGGGFNYGALLEKYFKKFCPKIERFTTSPDNLMKMVALHRIDYTFFSKENIEKFFKNYPQFAKKLKIVFIKEISEGIKRYIMCSKDVNDEIIRKIDNSIKELKNFK
jgi:ABC-type amino acid transport substrate-binding protein